MEDAGDLMELIGWDAADDPRWCGDWPAYQAWEQEVAAPRLAALGYTLGVAFYTGDSDSFGPLTRCVAVEKDGIQTVMMYG